MQGITSFQLITYMNVHQPVTVHMTVLLGIACNTCDGLRWLAFISQICARVDASFSAPRFINRCSCK